MSSLPFKKGGKAKADDIEPVASYTEEVYDTSNKNDVSLFTSHSKEKSSVNEVQEANDLSNQFIESMVHLGYFEDNLLTKKDSDNASIRSMPSSSKVKKRNLFGLNFKNKRRLGVDKTQTHKNSRYFGSDKPLQTLGSESHFGIDLSLDPQDLDGIVDTNLSFQPLTEEGDFYSSQANSFYSSQSTQQSLKWLPPESWNSQRKPSLAGEEDPSLELQLALNVEQMYYMRVFRKNETFVTIPCKLNDTVKELCLLLAKKLHIQDPSKFGLYIKKLGKGERLLYPLEKPVKLLVRLLLSVGYQTEELVQVVREDNSYLCQFAYREASLNCSAACTDLALPKEESENVSMRGQNLETVPVSLYRIADRIKWLDLSQNLLLDFPLDFAQLCISLTRLQLCRNDYQQVPTSLITLKGLRVLDVSNNWIQHLESGQLHNLGELDQLILCNNQIKAIPNDLAILSKLTVLDLSNNLLETFPLPICNMPQLRHLNLSFNTLVELPMLIGELTNLQTLLLANNALQGRLPQYFEQLASLSKLDVRNNRLTNIDVVGSMPHLVDLRCDHNFITRVDLQTNSFSQLSLSSNKIVLFGALQLDQLTDLNLSHCQLEALNDNLFTSMPQLVALKLANNKLTSIPKLSLIKLEVFQCVNNQLESLPDEMFALPRLLHVDVHNNRLKKLPSSIWSALALYFFNASSNSLVSFPVPPTPAPPINGSGAHVAVKPRFSSLSLALKLRHLILADNRLTEDIFSPISYLTQLHVLNLSCNDIYEVPPGGLYNLTSITELYLSGNQIASFPAEEVERLRHLKIFYLNANKLNSLPAELRKLGKLTVLDVANNTLNYNISNWSYDWNWNCNKELHYLNLSGNKRLKIFGAGLLSGESKFSPLADFNDLPKLRVLGLIDIEGVDVNQDQNSNLRVRAYDSVINEVGFGLADRLDRSESVCTWDFVVANFRELHNETLFGIFDSLTNQESSKFGMYLSNWTTFHLTSELRKLEKVDSKSEGAGDWVPKALRCAFLNLQREAVHSFGHELREGISALIVYRKAQVLYFAHVGDCLAVVSRKGKLRFCCVPHIPSVSDDGSEIARIRQTGGFITGDGRVNGETKLSRCFGVFHQLPTINSNPSIATVVLEESDELVILATRGLWDVMSYQTAIDIARTEIHDSMLAAQKLRDFAVAYGAEGSIMVMVLAVGDLFNKRLQVERRLIRSNLPRLDHTTGLNLSGPPDERRMMQYGNWKKIRNHPNSPSSSLPPTGQVVIVFTGIKNTTFLWENYPDDMALASRIHDNVLRDVLKQVGGYEVKNEGDTFMASFYSVPSAVLWCCLVQIRLLQAEWPPQILSLPDGQEIFDSESRGQVLYRGLSVRMGMNFGDPLCERDPMTGRMDYFGPMVNKAARVCGEAAFGEVCISSDVLAELINVNGLFDFEAAPAIDSQCDQVQLKLNQDVEELRKLSLRLVDIGERKLKGVELPEPLVLVFPKALIGRSLPERQKASVQPVPLTKISSEDHDQCHPLTENVRALGLICLRIELAVHAIISDTPAQENSFLQQQMISSISSSISSRELLKIIENICCRIENASTSLVLFQIGPTNQVLNAIRDYLMVYQSLSDSITPSKKQILMSTRYSHLNYPSLQ